MKKGRDKKTGEPVAIKVGASSLSTAAAHSLSLWPLLICWAAYTHRQTAPRMQTAANTVQARSHTRVQTRASTRTTRAHKPGYTPHAHTGCGQVQVLCRGQQFRARNPGPAAGERKAVVLRDRLSCITKDALTTRPHTRRHTASFSLSRVHT